MPRSAHCLAAALVACLWAGCSSAPNPADPTFGVASTTPGPTPFISFIQLSAAALGNLQTVGYVIQAKPGTVSKPVSVTFTLPWLQRGGYVTASTLTVPVFGLYAGFANTVNVQLQFQDQLSQSFQVVITTAPFQDSLGIYDQPTVYIPRAAGTSLGFDFFALKSLVEPVLIVDTDGAIRWVGSGKPSGAILFADGGFVVGSNGSADFSRLGLDGTADSGTLADPNVLDFNHNIDPGKLGVLVDLDTATGIDATLEEMGPSGAVLHTWDMAVLLAAYMSSQGDDAGAFVRPQVDWFHLNAATYDPADDSVIVSSRENFLIKIDYATGIPIWILGDPTKYWYSFPSLRAKALTLADGGLYPIGQHAVSITSDGYVMVFNDGYPSFNEPKGEPAGEQRTYSAVSAYSIDLANMTAQEVWDFDHDQNILSIVCSSAYEAPGKSLLVDYAMADGGSGSRLIGLDGNHNVIFDFMYTNPAPCAGAWNAVPVPLDNLQLN